MCEVAQTDFNYLCSLKTQTRGFEVCRELTR